MTHADAYVIEREEVVTASPIYRILSVSWGAIFVGVAVALATQLIINLVGIAAGAASIDPSSNGSPAASTLSYGAAFWFVLAGIAASLAGGFASGRLSGSPVPSTAAWHGLASWAATTLVIFYILTSAIGSAVGGASTLVGGALGGVASSLGGATKTAIEQVAPRVADPFTVIEDAIRTNSNGTDPEALKNAAVAAVRAAVTGDEAQAQAAREQAAQALASARNEPVEQARAEIQRFEQQYRATVDEARQQAAAAAQTAADVTAGAALFAALSLMLGAAASAVGGRFGARRA